MVPIFGGHPLYFRMNCNLYTSGLQDDLCDISGWTVNVACVFQGGLLADVSSTMATLQSVIQGVTRVRGVMRHIQAQTGNISADDSGMHSFIADRQHLMS